MLVNFNSFVLKYLFFFQADLLQAEITWATRIEPGYSLIVQRSDTKFTSFYLKRHCFRSR